MIAQRYEDLDCWQLSNELKQRVYAFIATPPASKDFEFCDQIRDSARGAPRTIAEGFGRFRPKEFARYMEFARASLMETQNHLGDALDSKDITTEEHAALFKLADRAIGARPRPRTRQDPLTFSTCSITRRMLPPRIFSMSDSE